MISNDHWDSAKSLNACLSLTVDVVLFTLREQALQVFLVRRPGDPFAQSWALPGGFVLIDEALDQAALRIMKKETDLDRAYFEQLYTYGHPARDPRGRVVTVAYFALISADAPIRLPESQKGEHIGWFTMDRLPTLAFDHSEILDYALRRLRYKLEYTAIGFELLPDEFTLSELQGFYEIILGETLDKRNFRRRVLQAGIIEATNRYRTGDGRPAQLYRYRENAVAEVKARRLFP